MATAWLDLSCGASADMLLGALVDAGVPFDVVSAAAASTGLPVALQRVPSRRGGLTTTWVITSTTTPQPASTPLIDLPLAEDAQAVLGAQETTTTTDIAEVAAVCAGLRWLREQGQLTSVSAWPSVESPLTAALVDSWEQQPEDHVGRIGLGAGSTEASDHAHVLKLVLAT